jgi:hypothetical protein
LVQERRKAKPPPPRTFLTDKTFFVSAPTKATANARRVPASACKLTTLGHGKKRLGDGRNVHLLEALDATKPWSNPSAVDSDSGERQ